jgi:predicted ATPase
VAASPLLGRDDELRELASLLSDGSRLVTVTGPGGTGKTRLALQAAAELVGAFSDGVFWVPLAGLSDPDLVPSSIARAIDARDALSEHLRAKELLILLDNAEHLLPAAPLLGELLAGSPRLRLLVTSRAPLRLSSEREYPLEPLGTSGSMALFVERARSVGRELEPSKTLEAICRRLDGLPLAIELAAARTKLLAPETLLQRLEHALPLLTGGARDAPKRQQTLRDTIEWSYKLLDGEAKRLFARLAVFAGSFSLEAAEEVCAADLDELAALVDFNLLKPIGESRFLMLETIREYATERLEESGEMDELRRAHSAYYAGLTNGLWAGLVRGETESWRVAEDEVDNVHAALEFSLACASEHALALAGELWPFWTARGYVRQGRRWVERALALPGRGDSAARKWALMSLSQLAKVQGDLQTATRATEDALRRFREINDQIRVSGILVELADFARAFGEVGRARALAEEALAVRRELGYAYGIARALLALGNVELAAGDLIRARTLLEDALERFREEAPDGGNTGSALEALGEVARRSGADARASSWFAEGLQLFARNGDEGSAAECLEGMACLAASGGDHERAARLAGAAEALYERSMTARWRPERHLPDRVEPAWSQGRSMTLDDAVEYALKGSRATNR